MIQRAHSPSPLRPCNSWKKQNRHSLDATATKAFHPHTGLPLLSSPVRSTHTHTPTLFCTVTVIVSFYVCICYHLHRLTHSHTQALTTSGMVTACALVYFHNSTFTALYFRPSEASLTVITPAQEDIWMFVMNKCWHVWHSYILVNAIFQDIRTQWWTHSILEVRVPGHCGLMWAKLVNAKQTQIKATDNWLWSVHFCLQSSWSLWPEIYWI